LPTVTLALAMGSQRMARKKPLIKTLTSVETLGSVTVICTDKTGTLTQNRMAVRRLWYDGEFFDPEAVAGSLAPKGGEGQGEGAAKRFDPLLRMAALCNNARIEEGEYRGDPTEAALLKMAALARGTFQAERLAEIPFDSERKRMTAVTRVDGEILVLTKGAMESLLPLCSHLWHRGEKVPLDALWRTQVTEACRGFMDQGLRVLAFAFRELDIPPHPGPLPLSGEREALEGGFDSNIIENDLVFAGLIGLEDPPRPEVPEAIRKCRSAGIRVIMITGDGGRTALAIGREIGLVTGNAAVIEGHEFGRMTDRELREKLGGKEILFARMTPKHKMRVVSILKDEGERVAVTGDGVNDAPALKKADIGIAMGIAGTDVAKEAADMILLDDNFATIVNAVEEGRGVYENIRKFISYIFASNIPEIVPYLAFVLFRIPLPLTILQILAVDLGTDMVPALALGAERPTKELMKQPPRDPKERLLNRKILTRSYLFLGPIEAAAGLFGFFYVLKGGGWTWGVMLSAADPLYMQATTACLTAIVITQAANVFACRSFNLSVFRIGFFSNRSIFAGIAVELLLQLFIVYHPWGNKIFATAPLTVEVWLVLIPFAVALFAAEEIRKKAASAFVPPR
ncbi:MAG: cation-transporting P-type ATPase, partial [Nitrospirae bacterium]|nr:cation-transporting P-type ATPase [Nitrospirota bacterium]